MTRAKSMALVVAVLMMVGGAVLAFTLERDAQRTSAPETNAGETSSPGGLLGNSFAQSRSTVPDAPSGVEPASTRRDDAGLGLEDLSPFMVKGGFGLFIGFAIGFAVRAFLRLAVVITGFYLLVLTMMAYAGWIEIHWGLMENQFTDLTTALGAQFESFRAFLTGAIPAGGLSAAGFAVGLRRK